MNILFVCTGNTCRSPMAEALLKHHSDGTMNVRSAGIFASEGSPASQQSIEVLKEEGVELDHSSKPLTKDSMEWADLVLTMTEGHKHAILSQFPARKDAVFTLKEHVSEDAQSEQSFPSKDVSDPFGGPVDVYRQTFIELQSLIRKLQKKYS